MLRCTLLLLLGGAGALALLRPAPPARHGRVALRATDVAAAGESSSAGGKSLFKGGVPLASGVVVPTAVGHDATSSAALRQGAAAWAPPPPPPARSVGSATAPLDAYVQLLLCGCTAQTDRVDGLTERHDSLCTGTSGYLSG